MEISTYNSEGKWIKPWEGRHTEFSDFNKRAFDEMELPYAPWTLRNDGILWDRRCTYSTCNRFARLGWNCCWLHSRATYKGIRALYFKVAVGMLFVGDIKFKKFEREVEERFSKGDGELSHYEYYRILGVVFDCQEACSLMSGEGTLKNFLRKSKYGKKYNDDIIKAAEYMTNFYIDEFRTKVPWQMETRLMEMLKDFIWAREYVEGYLE